MSMQGSIIKAYMRSRVQRLLWNISRAEIIQEQLRQELLQYAKDTAFGKEHRFAQINNEANFRHQIPVRDYDGLKPWFERTLLGEQNVVWPDDIQWFSKSSGTTSDRSKYIPVSKVTLKTAHYRGAFDVMSMYCYQRPNNRIFNGKTLILGGSEQAHPSGVRIRTGDISAVMICNQPLLADLLRTPRKAITLLPDFEAKLDITARESSKINVTGMAGVPTWNIVLLQKILKHTGKQHIGEVWPEMELYIHGGVNFEPYRANFRQLLPLKRMEYLQTYNASEGFFAFQDRLGADDMLLATHHGIYYEFIPQEQFHAEYPETVSLRDVEIGQQYALVITTNSGLWRYQIGDTIEFSSKAPYRLRVTGRTKSFINAFGEELIVENTDRAIAEAAKKCGAIIKDYTVAPIYPSYHEKGAHEWLIEFEQPPLDREGFITILDQALQSLNSDYEAKRCKNLAITEPKVHFGRTGIFYDWLRDHGKIGAQNKIPRLSNNREFLEALMKYQ
jgi:hypothetical protein